MTKADKVINQLENCVVEGDCQNCEYQKAMACRHYVMVNALSLIKEQKVQIESLRQSCQNMMEGLVVFRG